MKNTYSFKNSTDNLSFMFFKDIKEITPYYREGLQNSFEQSYEMNDIDIKNNDLTYNNYIKDSPILLILESNVLVGFLVFKYMPSIKALDYNLYIHSDKGVKVLKNLCEQAVVIYVYLAKDMYDFKMFYFNVSHKIVFNWANNTLKTGKCVKIRDNYFICYGKLSKKYIENIILKEVNILVNNN